MSPKSGRKRISLDKRIYSQRAGEPPEIEYHAKLDRSITMARAMGTGTTPGKKSGPDPYLFMGSVALFAALDVILTCGDYLAISDAAIWLNRVAAKKNLA